MRKAVLVALALALMSGLVINGCGEPAPEGQEVTFPDENLEECIREALDKPADEEITTTELATLTKLGAASEGISNISGLEYCTNLAHLDLALNQISDISPIANLTNLTFLCIGHNNKIQDISPLANLTKLTNLAITHNQMNDISTLANLSNLTELRLWDNQISDISPIANLTDLIYLNLHSNQIIDISPLAGLTKLTRLEIRSNQISDISALAHLTKLNSIDLSNNQIDDISSLVENPGLGEGDRVYLEENNLDLEEGSDDMENFDILEGRGVEVNYN